jgi:DeoR/GlpR family transcriptional regulator of sugar metabolism
VYGGAVLADKPVRQEKNTAPLAGGDLRQLRRAAVVREAIAMVREGDRIHLGNGVVVEEIARQLCRFRQLSIVTGSLAAVSQLIGSGHEVFLLGGKLHHDERNLAGSYAIQMAKEFHVNIAFIPCGGVSAEYGVMSDYLPAAELGRVGFENAQKAVLVCNSERIGRVTMHSVCPVSTLDVIITDEGISIEQKEALEACGVEVIVAKVIDE